jgi:hypothetical protein
MFLYRVWSDWNMTSKTVLYYCSYSESLSDCSPSNHICSFSNFFCHVWSLLLCIYSFSHKNCHRLLNQKLTLTRSTDKSLSKWTFWSGSSYRRKSWSFWYALDPCTHNTIMPHISINDVHVRSASRAVTKIWLDWSLQGNAWRGAAEIPVSHRGFTAISILNTGFCNLLLNDT